MFDIFLLSCCFVVSAYSEHAHRQYSAHGFEQIYIRKKKKEKKVKEEEEGESKKGMSGTKCFHLMIMGAYFPAGRLPRRKKKIPAQTEL